MFLSALILFIAAAGGMLLTYVYSERMPLGARVCAGVCTGFALLAGCGFVIASIGGMTAATPFLAAVPLTLPWLLLASRRLRTQFRTALLNAQPPVAMVVLLCIAAIGLGLVFSRGMFILPDGIYTGVANNLGDLPFHLQIISSFAYGQNFPPQDPAFAGVRFAYPFMADFLSALLVKCGASLEMAIWMPSIALVLSMIGLLWYWTRQITGDRLAAYLAPVLVLLSGGLGWLKFFDEAAASRDIFEFVQRLPHDYTIVPETIYRWGNSITTLFIPQRSILFGLPLSVFVFTLWWFAVVREPELDTAGKLSGKKKREKGATEREPAAAPETTTLSWPIRRMLAAGVLAGLLPLIHSHSYLVVMGIGACLALLYWNWRAWAAFFVPALLLGGIEGLWSTHGAGVETARFLGLHLGWDRGQHDPISFWWINTGLFIPLLVSAIFWRKDGKPLVSRQLLSFYLPFVFCFVIPNVLKLAPWVWDNIKVLFYWYVASVPLVALVLAHWVREKAGWKLASCACVLALTLSGGLDLLRVLSGTDRFNAYREFDNDGIAVAAQVRERTEPQAIVIGAMTYNPPMYLTGRRVLLGYPGTIWSRGLNSGSREQDIRAIYAGGPDAMPLLRQYNVSYAMVSPMEREMIVNDLFWQQFPVVAEAGPYRVYKVGDAR